MTAQTPDYLRYNGQPYYICGVSGTGLISPEQFNIKPEWADSGNWRGYVNTYSVRAKALVLTKLVVHSREYPPIDGIQAQPNIVSNSPTGDEEKDKLLRLFSPDIFEPYATGYQEYARLNIRVPLTGGLLAGRNFIDALYIHMGVQLPHTFKTLLECQFEDGRLIAVTNHSKNMAAMRRKIAEAQRAWRAAHQSEQAELTRLGEQVSQLRRAYFDGSLDGVSENERSVKEAAMRAELDPLERRKNDLQDRLAQPYYAENIIKQLSSSFALDYKL